MEQWLEAASKSLPAAGESLNAFHWESKRLVTTNDLILQLRSAAIGHEVLEASKPHIEQVAPLHVAPVCMPSRHALCMRMFGYGPSIPLGIYRQGVPHLHQAATGKVPAYLLLHLD